MGQGSDRVSGTSDVVRDLGGEMGALIIYTGQDHCGQDIEISPVNQAAETSRTRAEVREWRVRDAVFFSAVYPDLCAGAYQVWWDGTTPAGQIVIRGGSVTEFAWPAHPGG